MGREMDIYNEEVPLIYVGGIKWGGKLERK